MTFSVHVYAQLKIGQNKLKRVGIAKILCDIENPHRKRTYGVKFYKLFQDMHSQKLTQSGPKRSPVDSNHVR